MLPLGVWVEQVMSLLSLPPDHSSLFFCQLCWVMPDPEGHWSYCWDVDVPVDTKESSQ